MELIIEDSSDGRLFNISEIASDIKLDTEINVAAKLTFSYLKQGRMFVCGSVVRFKTDKSNVFYGYIFETENTSDEMITVTAYDQLRYLKYKDSIMVSNKTLGSFLKFICDKSGVKWGNVADTKYNLGSKLFRGKTYLDMIKEGQDDTLIATKNKYVLYDKFGVIELQEAKDLRLPLIFGDESFAYEYAYSRSIDGDTYNKVKLAQVQKDKAGNTFINQTYVAEDKITQKKWGVLQYYEEVSDTMDSTKIKQRANDLLRLYNSEQRKLNLNCLGDSRVKAGYGVMIHLANLQINQYFIVKKATHSFEGIHTMELELIVA